MLLLRLFVIPRLSNAIWQLLAIFSVTVICFIFKQYTIIPIVLGIYMFLTFYTITSSNLVDNVEWLRNSLYTPRQLLFFYFLEQTLMMFVLLVPIICIIFFFVFNSDVLRELISNKSTLGVIGPVGSAAVASKPLLNKFQFDYSSIELALETIFSLFFTLAFVFGGGLIKTYFMHVKFEKKYSAESKMFNALLFISFIYLAVKDIDALIFLAPFKIILFPLLLCIGMFIMLYAGNNGFMVYHNRSWKSPIVKIPAISFVILFIMSLGFSKFSYTLQTDNVAKFSEIRFQGIFASSISEKQVDKFYLSSLDDYNFKYLKNNYEPSDNLDFTKAIQVRKSLSQLDGLWSVMNEDVKLISVYSFVNQMDSIVSKKPKSFENEVKSLLKENVTLGDYYRDNQKDFKSLYTALENKEKENGRATASKLTTETE